MNNKPPKASGDNRPEDQYEPLKRYTKEELSKYLETKPTPTTDEDSKQEQHEPLKRYTRKELKAYLATRLKQDMPETSQAVSIGGTTVKTALASLVESHQGSDKTEQDFPRAATAKPCKPEHDSDPKARIMVVVLIIALFVGLATYLVIKNRLDKNKPHVTPKNMPMRMLGGLHGEQR